MQINKLSLRILLVFGYLIALQSPCIHAAINQNAAEKQGCTLYEDSNNNTPLHKAALANDMQAVQELLQQKQSVHCKNRAGQTPLHLALTSKNWDIARLLRAQEQHDEALLKAIKEKTADSPVIAITAGAMPYATDPQNHGWTALHYAVSNHYHNTLDRLLTEGVNTNMVDTKGYTPLHTALISECPECINALIRCSKTKFSVEDAYGDRPLHMLCYSEKLPEETCISMIHSMSPIILRDIDKPNDEGFTPLHMVVGQNKNEILKLFLKNKNLDLSLSTYEDVYTPLMMATIRGNAEAVELLLAHPNDSINCCDKEGLTALDLAVLNQYPEIVALLLDDGRIILDKSRYDELCKIAEINKSNEAAQQEIITLLKKHYRAHTHDFSDYLELQLAKQNTKSKKQKAKPVKAPATKQPQTLFDAINLKSLTACQKILGTNPEAVNVVDDATGNTPLHYALKTGALDCAQYLLAQQTLNTNILNNDGHSPLHVAIGKPNSGQQQRNILKDLTNKTSPELVESIAQQYTDKKQYPLVGIVKKSLKENSKNAATSVKKEDTDNSWPETPFERMACLITIGDNSALAALEAELQIMDINMQDTQGKTLLHHASEANNTGALIWLLEHGADQDIINNDGKTPQNRATSKGHTEASLTLSAYESVHQAFRTGHRKAIDFYLKLQGFEGLASLGTQNKKRDNTDALPLCLGASHLHDHALRSAFTFVRKNYGPEALGRLLGMVEPHNNRNILHWLADHKKEPTGSTNTQKLNACVSIIFNQNMLQDQAYAHALAYAAQARDNNGLTPRDLAAKNELSSLVALLG